MCQCGCGDFNGYAQFPGPDGIVYVIDFYTGCKDCNESPGPTIRKMTEEELKKWYCEDLPCADFGDIGDLALTPLFGSMLRKNLVCELEGEIPDIDSYLKDTLSDAMIKAAMSVAERWRKGNGCFPWNRSDDTGF